MLKVAKKFYSSDFENKTITAHRLDLGLMAELGRKELNFRLAYLKSKKIRKVLFRLGDGLLSAPVSRKSNACL